jgi:hypothetical protein
VTVISLESFPRNYRSNGKGWPLNLSLWCRDVRATSAERDLLFTLASYCNCYAETFVGLETLAAKIGKTERQVRRLLRSLEKARHLETVHRSTRDPKSGKWTGSNLYRLNVWGVNDALRTKYPTSPADISSTTGGHFEPAPEDISSTNPDLKCPPKVPCKGPQVRNHIEDSPTGENDRDSFKGPDRASGHSENPTGPNSPSPSGTSSGQSVNGGGAAGASGVGRVSYDWDGNLIVEPPPPPSPRYEIEITIGPGRGLRRWEIDGWQKSRCEDIDVRAAISAMSAELAQLPEESWKPTMLRRLDNLDREARGVAPLPEWSLTPLPEWSQPERDDEIPF